MKEQEFLDSLEDLTGKVVIVTGGAKGIGLETTIYLALKGATVYVAGRKSAGTDAGIEEARRRVQTSGSDGAERIKYHELDLTSMQGAWRSAQEFKKVQQKLDILVCNAGVSMTTLESLSPDGYEMMFAVNNLGHFAFVLGLLDIIEDTANSTQDGRIILTLSDAYKTAKKLDYEQLTTSKPGDGKALKDIADAWMRYAGSKLAMVYLTIELSTRIRNIGMTNISLNACHPGNAIHTTLGVGHQKAVNPLVERGLRSLLHVTIGHSVADTAKTQVYLAGSKTIKEKDIHGEYWAPENSMLTRSYQRCKPEEYTQLGQDEEERKKLWKVNVDALKKAIGEEDLNSVESVRKIINDESG